METEPAISAPTLHLAFIALCVSLLVIVYAVPWFDLRSLRRLTRRARKVDVAEEPGRHGPVADLLDRPDLGAILNLLVILGTGIAMLVGWRVPTEIERVYGAGASFGLLFPDVEMTTLGRGAQVIGMVCLGLIALRLLRILVLFAAAGMVCLGAAAALNYVFDWDLFGLF